MLANLFVLVNHEVDDINYLFLLDLFFMDSELGPNLEI